MKLSIAGISIFPQSQTSSRIARRKPLCRRVNQVTTVSSISVRWTISRAGSKFQSLKIDRYLAKLKSCDIDRHIAPGSVDAIW